MKHHNAIKGMNRLRTCKDFTIVENLKSLTSKVKAALAPGTFFVEALGSELVDSFPDLFAYRQENYDDIQKYMPLETYRKYCQRLSEILGFNLDWMSEKHLVMIYDD